jgi:hypothetical protein
MSAAFAGRACEWRDGELNEIASGSIAARPPVGTLA